MVDPLSLPLGISLRPGFSPLVVLVFNPLQLLKLHYHIIYEVSLSNMTDMVSYSHDMLSYLHLYTTAFKDKSPTRQAHGAVDMV